jgi:hypothetical protein
MISVTAKMQSLHHRITTPFSATCPTKIRQFVREQILDVEVLHNTTPKNLIGVFSFVKVNHFGEVFCPKWNPLVATI